MSSKIIQLSILIIITLCTFVLLFFIFKPYLSIIFISCILSVVFYPLYQKFIFWFKGREGLASSLTVLVILVVIVIPTMFVASSVFSEAVSMYNNLAFNVGNQEVFANINSILSKFGQTMFYNYSISIENYLRDILSWVIWSLNSFFTSIFDSILGFILMLISVYYLLINGTNIKEKIIKLSPLPDYYNEEVLNNLRFSVDEVFRGRFLVAMAQGFFLALGFLIFGIASPVLWGFVGGLASLVPILGISVIVLPASLYLFMNGSIFAGLGMLIWGALGIGLVDDTLSFFIIKKKIKINPVIIFFSVLGGVQFFGPLGFILGPVLVSAVFAFTKILSLVIFYKNSQSIGG